MKKLIFLLIALPLMALSFVSCSDDSDDIPDVNIGFTYSGATAVNGTLYSVLGDTLSIDSVYCTPAAGTKPAMIGNVSYILDGRPLAFTPVVPFNISLLTGSMPVGRHQLTLQMTVLQEGKSIGTAWMPVQIAIVSAAADIPSGANPSDPDSPSTYNGTAKISK